MALASRASPSMNRVVKLGIIAMDIKLAAGDGSDVVLQRSNHALP